ALFSSFRARRNGQRARNEAKDAALKTITEDLKHAIHPRLHRGDHLAAAEKVSRQSRLAVRTVPPRRAAGAVSSGHVLYLGHRAGRRPWAARTRRSGRLLLFHRTAELQDLPVG